MEVLKEISLIMPSTINGKESKWPSLKKYTKNKRKNVS